MRLCEANFVVNCKAETKPLIFEIRYEELIQSKLTSFKRVTVIQL